jgi:hypothetical protein
MLRLYHLGRFVGPSPHLAEASSEPKSATKHGTEQNQMKRFAQQLAIFSCAFLALSASAQTAGQDMKNAGHDTADATKQAAHKTARATKRGTHKAAHATKKGANKVEEKTDPNNPK